MNWFSIMEYSLKKSISPSTIRRKIKNNTINFKLDGGKYLIQDDSQTNQSATCYSEPKTINDVLNFTEKTLNEMTRINTEFLEEKDKIIRLQEQNIKELKEEIAEFKMLVDVLEKGR